MERTGHLRAAGVEAPAGNGGGHSGSGCRLGEHLEQSVSGWLGRECNWELGGTLESPVEAELTLNYVLIIENKHNVTRNSSSGYSISSLSLFREE